MFKHIHIIKIFFKAQCLSISIHSKPNEFAEKKKLKMRETIDNKNKCIYWAGAQSIISIFHNKIKSLKRYTSFIQSSYIRYALNIGFF